VGGGGLLFLYKKNVPFRGKKLSKHIRNIIFSEKNTFSLTNQREKSALLKNYFHFE